MQEKWGRGTRLPNLARRRTGMALAALFSIPPLPPPPDASQTSVGRRLVRIHPRIRVADGEEYVLSHHKTSRTTTKH